MFVEFVENGAAFWFADLCLYVFVWLLLWVFCARGFLGGLLWVCFLLLGCGLGFVRLLLWLWERFFNMVVARASIEVLWQSVMAVFKRSQTEFINEVHYWL